MPGNVFGNPVPFTIAKWVSIVPDVIVFYILIQYKNMLNQLADTLLVVQINKTCCKNVLKNLKLKISSQVPLKLFDYHILPIPEKISEMWSTDIEINAK